MTDPSTHVDLRDRVALITGAGSGIGRATSLWVASLGAKVVASDIRGSAAEATAAEIRRNGGDAVGVRCDVADEGEVDAVARLIRERFGRLDAAHNNAGALGPQGIKTDEFRNEDFDRTLAVHVRGTFLCLKAELQLMAANDHGGSIVNTVSVAGFRGGVAGVAYTAAKHAIVGMTKASALEFARDEIRVNAVAPGVVATALLDEQSETGVALREAAARYMPIGRLGRVEEVAAAVAWLFSDQSSLVTGTTLALDGGWLAAAPIP